MYLSYTQEQNTYIGSSMEQYTKNIVGVSDSDCNIDKMGQEVKAERQKTSKETNKRRI